MATISTLAVNLIARTSVFERGMKRSRKSMGRFRKEASFTSSRIKAFAAGFLASGGAVMAIKSFTNAASTAQETLNLFNTVFAENSAATAKWADSFAKDVGRSKTEVKEWAASLQDTFVPLGFARKRAAELSKSLVELAVDVGSFKNIASDREVIDAFTSGIVGNHRAVRAYGVVITNATIEMAAFKAGLNKAFNELTELEKVQLRYNIIMESTRDAQGDAIKTAANYSNQVKKLKGQWMDLKESIGSSILPAMTKLVTLITRNAKAIGFLIKSLGSFVAKSAIFLGTILLIHKAISGIIRLLKALATAQVVTLSLGGPAAWAKLAVSIGVAAAAMVGLNKVLDGTIAKFETLKNKAGLEKEAALVKEIAGKRRVLARIEAKTKGFASGDIKANLVNKFKESISLLEKRLKVIREEKKAVEAATKARKDQIDLMARVKQGDPLLDKILSDALKDPAGATKSGRFQTIRSDFVDVAALNPSNKNNGIEKNNILTETTNSLLRQLNQNAIGVYQT